MASPGCTARLCVAALALLALAVGASAGACPTTCVAKQRGIVVFPGNPWKELSPSKGSTMTLIECYQKAYKTGQNYYQYIQKTKRCFATTRCWWTWGGATGLTVGRISDCPTPPPDHPPYCSARMSHCRCRYPLYCKDSGDQKVCCCPDALPNPIIKNRRLYGCKR